MQASNNPSTNDNPNADPERQPLQRHPLPPRPSRVTLDLASHTTAGNRQYSSIRRGSNPTSRITRFTPYQPARSRQHEYDHDQSLKAKGPVSHPNKSSASGMTQIGDHSAAGVHLVGMGPNDDARVGRRWGPPSGTAVDRRDHGLTRPKAEEALRRNNPKIPHRSATPTGNGCHVEEDGLEEGEIEEVEIEEGEIGEEREEVLEEGKDEDEDFDTISLGSD